MPKRKTPVRAHKKTMRKTGKKVSVAEHIRRLPQDVRKRVIAFEDEKRKRELEGVKKDLEMAKSREKEARRIAKEQKKITKTKEDLFDSLEVSLRPKLEKQYDMFKVSGKWEVYKSPFDRHAFNTKKEAQTYKDYRITNDIRKKAGLSQNKRDFDFVEVPEIKERKDRLKAVGKKIREEFQRRREPVEGTEGFF